MLDEFYWNCPEEQIDPPYEPWICDQCGEVIQSDEDAGEIQGMFPRILCKRCAEDAEADGDAVRWFVA